VIVGPCTLVMGGSDPQVLPDAAVRVVGAHIAQIGLAGSILATHPGEPVWPAAGRVVMPGVVNTHAHLARHLARGLGLCTPADWRRYERSLAPEDVRWAVTAALIEGVRHGVTTVIDFHRSTGCPDLSLSEIAGAARAVGVRTATCYGASEFDSPDERRAANEESLAFAEEVRRERTSRFGAMLGVHATTLDGLDGLLHHAFEAAGERVPVHVDLALEPGPGGAWRGAGAWRDRAHPALWAHAESAPAALVGLARLRGDALAVAGAAPPAAGAADLEMAWGSDVSANAPPLGDEGGMRGPRAEAHYRRLFVNGPRYAERLFGRGLGALLPGSPADLVMLDYDPATELNSRTLLGHLWAGLLRAPVNGVMVAGEVVLEDGRLTRLDEREAAACARASARRVWERMS
jgi:cytosine/adenosine deaminase-related metal-dependent hydrolase